MITLIIKELILPNKSSWGSCIDGDHDLLCDLYLVIQCIVKPLKWVQV